MTFLWKTPETRKFADIFCDATEKTEISPGWFQQKKKNLNTKCLAKYLKKLFCFRVYFS
jgi:hypothetical protein